MTSSLIEGNLGSTVELYADNTALTKLQRISWLFLSGIAVQQKKFQAYKSLPSLQSFRQRLEFILRSQWLWHAKLLTGLHN